MSRETLRGLERGLSVLDALEGTEGLSLRELHRHTDLPKPTLLRILATLEAKGYARRRIADGGWRRTAHRGKPPSSRLDALLNDIGGEVLDELCRRVVWPSDLAVYRHGAMEILDTSRRLTPFVINHAGIGLRIPILQSGLGLAWLAYCSEDERKAALAIMMASDNPYDRPVREPGVADEAIAETRARGYAVRAKGYQPRRHMTQENTCGIALPIFASGRVVATVNLVWILSALDVETFVGRYLQDLRGAAEEIGRRVEKAADLRDETRV
jgi:IclR family mhp operon transcriptional activator